MDYGFINRDINKTDKFTIIYIGNMGKNQSPEPVLQAVDNFPAKIKDKTEFIIVGKVFDGFDELRNKYKNVIIILHDYMPYKTAMNFSRSASLLLLINPLPIYGADLIPVKLYDYIALRKPILAIGTKGGRLEDLIDETACGKLFEKNDNREISDFIKSEFINWENKGYILLKDDKILDKYRARNNVKKLSELLNKVS